MLIISFCQDGRLYAIVNSFFVSCTKYNNTVLLEFGRKIMYYFLIRKDKQRDLKLKL